MIPNTWYQILVELVRPKIIGVDYYCEYDHGLGSSNPRRLVLRSVVINPQCQQNSQHVVFLLKTKVNIPCIFNFGLSILKKKKKTYKKTYVSTCFNMFQQKHVQQKNVQLKNAQQKSVQPKTCSTKTSQHFFLF